MKRIFAAIKIEPSVELLESFEALKQSLKHEKIKWVGNKNLHLTLKFFGETPEEKVNEICSEFKKISADSFNIRLMNLKIFGSHYKPRVIFMETTLNPNLEKLSNLIQESILPLGFDPGRDAMVLHLTLGRIKNISDIRYFQQIIQTTSNSFALNQYVDRFYLFESILRTKGPEYHVLETFFFKKN